MSDHAITSEFSKDPPKNDKKYSMSKSNNQMIEPRRFIGRRFWFELYRWTQ